MSNLGQSQQQQQQQQHQQQQQQQIYFTPFDSLTSVDNIHKWYIGHHCFHQMRILVSNCTN